MTVYIVKRLLLMVVTLFGITMITFLVTRLTPGEPSGPAAVAGAGDSIPFDDVLEQNRRNLGLDKPMFFNLRFEDRGTAAEGALRDFIRPVRFWQEDGRRRLRLSSTLALEPAVGILQRLLDADNDTMLDHYFRPTSDPLRAVDTRRSLERLLDYMPAIAQQDAGIDPELPPAERVAAWSAWVSENAPTWTRENVARSVESFLASGDVSEVRVLGGHAVPALMRALNGRDDERAQRANRGLVAVLGFNYLTNPDSWAEEKSEVVTRWNSLYRRERIRFSSPGAIRHTWNIVANTQFGVWCGQVARLDFGTSYKYRRPVTTLIKERLPITIVLSVLSIFFAYLIAIPLGVLSAVRRYTPEDKVITVLLFVLYSLPSFWVAQMLLLALTGGPSPFPGRDWPDIFPVRGMNQEGLDWRTGNPRALIDLAWHIALPTLVLTYGSLAFLSRQMRSAMLETLGQDFIRTAEAKGLPSRAVILRHAFRNSLIPILTISAGLLPELIAGSIIVESIFTIPGMGLLSFDAILSRDYPVINAILFFAAALTLLGILIADLSYAIVDPRITYDS